MMFEIDDIIWVRENSIPYKCKVVAKRNEGSEIKVHFVRFKEKYDIWLATDSPRIVDPPQTEPISSSQPSTSARPDAEANRRKRRHSTSELDGEDRNSRKKSHIEVTDPQGSSQLTDAGVLDRMISSVDGRGGAGVDDTGPPIQPDVFASLAVLDTNANLSPMNNPVAVTGTDSTVSPNSLRGSTPSCSLCHMVVNGQVVKCGGCQGLFHPAVSCLGVGQSVVNVLIGDESSAIRYFCCVCRDRDNSALPAEQATGGQTATLQILTMIGSLVADVKKLSERVEQAAVGQRATTVVQSSQSPENIPNGDNPPLSRKDVLSEVREMYERDKRKSSVVLRGLGNVTVQQASSTYAAVCRYLGLEVSPLTELTKINANLFRGRINDANRRQELLAAVPLLRRSDEFGSVYIQKDLTYRQRGEVIAARSARRSGNRTGNADAASNHDHMSTAVQSQAPVSTEDSYATAARSSAPRGGPAGNVSGQRGRGNRGRPRGSISSRGGGGPNRGRGGSAPRGLPGGGNRGRGRGRGGTVGDGEASGLSDSSQSRVLSGRFGEESLGQGGPLSSPPLTRNRHIQRNVDLNE